MCIYMIYIYIYIQSINTTTLDDSKRFNYMFRPCNWAIIRFLAVTVHNKTELTALCWLSDNTTMMLHSVDFQNFQKQPRVSIITAKSRFCLAERPVVRRANLRKHWEWEGKREEEIKRNITTASITGLPCLKQVN